MKQMTIILSLFVCLLTTAGCSSTPSDSQARKIVQTSSAALIEMGAKMVKFEKHNAVSKEVEGQKFYDLEYLAAFKLPSGIAWATNTGLAAIYAPGGGFVKDPGVSETYGAGAGTKYTSLPEGTIAAERGTIHFRLTEKGWISGDSLENVQLGYCTGPTTGEFVVGAPRTSPEECFKSLKWDKLN